MPVNTSDAFVLWCSVYEHLANAPLCLVFRAPILQSLLICGDLFSRLGVRPPVPCCPPVLQQRLFLFCGVMFSITWRTPPCPVLCPPILQLLLFCGVLFSNTWRMPPCPVLCPPRLQLLLLCGVMFSNTWRTTPSGRYFNSFCFVVLCFPTLGVRPLVPSYAR